MFHLIEQSYEIYVDCEARCLMASRFERTRDTLEMCRDQCQLLEYLEKEDPRYAKYYNKYGFE